MALAVRLGTQLQRVVATRAGGCCSLPRPGRACSSPSPRRCAAAVTSGRRLVAARPGPGRGVAPAGRRLRARGRGARGHAGGWVVAVAVLGVLFGFIAPSIGDLLDSASRAGRRWAGRARSRTPSSPPSVDRRRRGHLLRHRGDRPRRRRRARRSHRAGAGHRDLADAVVRRGDAGRAGWHRLAARGVGRRSVGGLPRGGRTDPGRRLRGCARVGPGGVGGRRAGCPDLLACAAAGPSSPGPGPPSSSSSPCSATCSRGPTGRSTSRRTPGCRTCPPRPGSWSSFLGLAAVALALCGRRGSASGTATSADGAGSALVGAAGLARSDRARAAPWRAPSRRAPPASTTRDGCRRRRPRW